MPNEPRPSFWQTLPGMLTALGGVIAAATGLITALYQTGMIGSKGSTAAPASTSAPATAGGPANDTTSGLPAASANTSSDSQAPAASGPTAPSDAPARLVNLLSAENGGQVVVTSGDNWLKTIDGKEDFNQIDYGLRDQTFAVFGFAGDMPARIEKFTMLVPATQDNNVKEFELLVGNASPTGRFESLGTFTTQNLKLVRTPFQEFTFPPVTARYLKVRLISSYGATHPELREVQLFGTLVR